MNQYDFQMDGLTVSLDTGKKFQFFAGGTAGNEKLSGGECKCGNGIVSVRYHSDLWEEHDFIIECQRDFISFRHRLKGKGTIGKLSYLCSSEYGFAGNFSDVFNTAPNFQQRRYYHPADSIRISNGNNLDSNCGGQALASPLHLFGLGNRGEKGWIAAGMFSEPGNYRWDDFWWNPVPEISPTGYEPDKFLIGGFAIDYAGKESIDGEWFSPRLVFSFSDTEESILSTALKTAFQNGWMNRVDAYSY